MGSLLRGVLIWVLSSFLLKVSAVLGVGIITYKTLYTLVESFFGYDSTSLKRSSSAYSSDNYYCWCARGVEYCLRGHYNSRCI